MQFKKLLALLGFQIISLAQFAQADVAVCQAIIVGEELPLFCPGFQSGQGGACSGDQSCGQLVNNCSPGYTIQQNSCLGGYQTATQKKVCEDSETPRLCLKDGQQILEPVCCFNMEAASAFCCPSGTPAPTASPTAVATNTRIATPTRAAATQTATPTRVASITPTRVASVSPTPTNLATPMVTETPLATIEPTIAQTKTATATTTAVATQASTSTPSSPTATPTQVAASATPTAVATPTDSSGQGTATPTAVATPTNSNGQGTGTPTIDPNLGTPTVAPTATIGSEQSGDHICSNGKDDDGDGLIDYPNDPGCASATDEDETNRDGALCDNGIDDDGDGKIDMRDPQCCSPIDNTENGDANCTDQCKVIDIMKPGTVLKLGPALLGKLSLQAQKRLERAASKAKDAILLEKLESLSKDTAPKLDVQIAKTFAQVEQLPSAILVCPQQPGACYSVDNKRALDLYVANLMRLRAMALRRFNNATRRGLTNEEVRNIIQKDKQLKSFGDRVRQAEKRLIAAARSIPPKASICVNSN